MPLPSSDKGERLVVGLTAPEWEKNMTIKTWNVLIWYRQMQLRESYHSKKYQKDLTAPQDIRWVREGMVAMDG